MAITDNQNDHNHEKNSRTLVSSLALTIQFFKANAMAPVTAVAFNSSFVAILTNLEQTSEFQLTSLSSQQAHKSAL